MKQGQQRHCTRPSFHLFNPAFPVCILCNVYIFWAVPISFPLNVDSSLFVMWRSWNVRIVCTLMEWQKKKRSVLFNSINQAYHMIRTLTFCTAVWERIDATCEGSKVVGTTLRAEGSALKRAHLRDAVTPAMCSKLDFCRAGRTNCCCQMKDAGSPSRSAVQRLHPGFSEPPQRD